MLTSSGGGPQRKQKIGGGTFGVDFAEQCRRSKVHALPCIVLQCVQEIDNRGLHLKGIYRVSGVKSRIERICELFEREKEVEFLNLMEVSPHVIANVLKFYLRQLPEPLLTFHLYPHFISLAKEFSSDSEFGCEEALLSRCVNSIRELVRLLPDENFQTTSFLMKHLNRVCENSTENNMSASNLGIVFGPTLLWPHEGAASLQSLADTTQQARVVELMVRHARVAFSASSLLQPLSLLTAYQQQQDSESNVTRKSSSSSQPCKKSDSSSDFELLSASSSKHAGLVISGVTMDETLDHDSDSLDSDSDDERTLPAVPQAAESSSSSSQLAVASLMPAASASASSLGMPDNQRSTVRPPLLHSRSVDPPSLSAFLPGPRRSVSSDTGKLEMPLAQKAGSSYWLSQHNQSNNKPSSSIFYMPSNTSSNKTKPSNNSSSKSNTSNNSTNNSSTNNNNGSNNATTHDDTSSNGNVDNTATTTHDNTTTHNTTSNTTTTHDNTTTHNTTSNTTTTDDDDISSSNSNVDNNATTTHDNTTTHNTTSNNTTTDDDDTSSSNSNVANNTMTHDNTSTSSYVSNNAIHKNSQPRNITQVQSNVISSENGRITLVLTNTSDTTPQFV